MPHKLMPTFQYYSWGDDSFIQNLCSLTHLKGSPVAEMWLGAHPKSPSLLEIDDQHEALDKYISERSASALGSAVDVYEGKLPFLFKLLAAKEPLSIQLHPDKQAAEAGFAYESKLGISINDAMRTYKDNNHKPELLCALTDFTALCGFRTHQEMISIINSLGLELLWNSFVNYAANPCSITLKCLFTEYLSTNEEQMKEAIGKIESYLPGDDYAITEAQAMCCNLVKHYQLDRGVLAPLFLNIVNLSPFEAIFIDAGILHAYIHGAGLELMANSDNVIRGGLTSKHVDIKQILANTRFAPQPAILVGTDSSTPNLHSYYSPASEFKLSLLELDANQLIHTYSKPMIMLCLHGSFNCSDNLHIGTGEAIFIAASEASVTLSGTALIAIASL